MESFFVECVNICYFPIFTIDILTTDNLPVLSTNELSHLLFAELIQFEIFHLM